MSESKRQTQNDTAIYYCTRRREHQQSRQATKVKTRVQGRAWSYVQSVCGRWLVAAVAFARGGVVVVGRQLGGGVVDVVGGRFVYRRCQVDAAPAGGASGGHSRRPADTTSIVAAPVPLGPPKKKKKGSLGVEKLDDYAVVRRFLNFRIFNRGFWWCGGAADSGSLGKHSSVGLLGRCRTMGHPVESCAPNWVLL